ncbi:hypothetical protein D3C72_1322960 [compost metagenome]
MRRIQPRHDRLLDFRTGKPVGRRCQCRQREVVGIELAPPQVQPQQFHAHIGRGQVDEEDLVEAALAQQLCGQLVYLVGGGHDEHRRLALGHPGQQVAEHAARHAAILAAGGQALFDLIHPQHAWRQLLGRGQRLAQVGFGLAVVLVVQRAHVQAQQRHAKAGGGGLGQHRFAAALHAQQQHAAWRVQPGRCRAGDEGDATLVDPALQPVGPGHVAEARAVVLEEQVAAAVEQLELQPRQLWQVVVAQRAIGVDQLPRDAPRIDQAQALQVLQDLLDRLAVHFHPPPAVFACIGIGFFAQHLQ